MRIEEWETLITSDPRYEEALQEIEFAQGVADEVVRLRIQAGLSQAELARRARTTQAAISKLECGDGNPTIGKVTRVLSVLLRAVARSESTLASLDAWKVGTVDVTASVVGHMTGEWAISTDSVAKTDVSSQRDSMAFSVTQDLCYQTA